MLYICARLPVEALMVGEETGIITSIPMEKSGGEAGASHGALSSAGTSVAKEENRKTSLLPKGFREMGHLWWDYAVDHWPMMGNGYSSATSEKVEGEPSSATPCIIPAHEWVIELAPRLEAWRGRLRLRHAWWVAWQVLREHGEMKEVQTPLELQQKLCQGLDAYEKNLMKSERTREHVCGKGVKRPSQLFKHVPSKELGSLPPSQWREAAGDDNKLLDYVYCAQQIEYHFDSLRHSLLHKLANSSGRR